MTGTFPHYNDRQLDFAAPKAILARASVSQGSYRTGFDVSLPLFYPNLPMRLNHPLNVTRGIEYGSPTRYFLTFKGRVDTKYEKSLFASIMILIIPTVTRKALHLW